MSIDYVLATEEGGWYRFIHDGRELDTCVFGCHEDAAEARSEMDCPEGIVILKVEAVQEAEYQRKYPEHVKLEDTKKVAETFGEFLEFLREKKGLRLCEWKEEHPVRGRFHAKDISMFRALVDFFEIDPAVLAQEQRQMKEES